MAFRLCLGRFNSLDSSPAAAESSPPAEVPSAASFVFKPCYHVLSKINRVASTVCGVRLVDQPSAIKRSLERPGELHMGRSTSMPEKVV